MNPSRATSAWSSGIFRRTFATFVIAVLIACLVGAFAMWFLVARRSEAWVGNAIALLAEANDSLADKIERRAPLGSDIAVLEQELGTQLAVYDLEGQRIAGHGAARVPKRARRFVRQLARGRPVVRPRDGQDQLVLYPLTGGNGELLATVVARPPKHGLLLPLGVAAVAMLVLMALAARGLARSLSSRLAQLEHSSGRIAKGELSHRVPIPDAPPRDEVDELGLAFNDMATKVEGLIEGKRALLANVSHELRTPLARVKVVLELLDERLELLRTSVDPAGHKHHDRLQAGLCEIMRDNNELETLIADLLTSGRLELRAEGGQSLQASEIELVELLAGVAAPVQARVECDGEPSLIGDRLLLERLFSNLLANARRACPEGDLAIYVRPQEEGFEIAVEDEGYGITPEDRDRVFEPFRRLDAARSRDAGGVGLGLYLCRQIARAHGGEILAAARIDGRRGARMVVTLSNEPY